MLLMIDVHIKRRACQVRSRRWRASTISVSSCGINWGTLSVSLPGVCGVTFEDARLDDRTGWRIYLGASIVFSSDDFDGGIGGGAEGEGELEKGVL